MCERERDRERKRESEKVEDGARSTKQSPNPGTQSPAWQKTTGPIYTASSPKNRRRMADVLPSQSLA